MTLTLQQVADKLEIQDTLTRYSTALDVPGRKWEEWDRCFAPDAVCDYTAAYGSTGSNLSREELKDLFKRNDAVRISGQHLLMNIVIAVSGDAATARTECFYASLNRIEAAGRARLTFAGVWFDDNLVRLTEGWRIHHRIYHSRWNRSEEVDWKG